MKKILAILMAFCLVLSLAACGNKNKEFYKSLEGDYSDEFSGRAVASVTANDDCVVINVHWGSSASEYTSWAMTCKLDKDGKTLNYEDEVIFEGKSDEKGELTETTMSEGGKGYFVVEDGKLLWTGAADESCKECVFAKY